MTTARWWKLGSFVHDEAREQARLAAASAVIAKDNLRESCRLCGDLGDIARMLISRLPDTRQESD